MRRTPAILAALPFLFLAGCTGKPLVHGLMDSEGTVYRESEQEEFGARTTVKVRTFEF